MCVCGGGGVVIIFEFRALVCRLRTILFVKTGVGSITIKSVFQLWQEICRKQQMCEELLYLKTSFNMRLMDILIIYSNCQYDNIPYRVYGSRVQEAATAKVQEIFNFFWLIPVIIISITQL